MLQGPAVISFAGTCCLLWESLADEADVQSQAVIILCCPALMGWQSEAVEVSVSNNRLLPSLQVILISSCIHLLLLDLMAVKAECCSAAFFPSASASLHFTKSRQRA